MPGLHPLEALVAEALQPRARESFVGAARTLALAGLAPLERLPRLLEAQAERSGRPLLPFELGQRLAPGAFGLTEYLARSAPTVGEALAAATRHARLLSPRLEPELWVGPRRCAWVFLARDGTFCLEALKLGALLQRVRAVAPDLPLLAARLAAGSAEQRQQLETALAPLTLEAGDGETGLVFDSASLGRALGSADAPLHRVLRDEARAVSPAPAREWAARTRAALARCMDGKGLGLERLAERLDTTPRRLQRHLAAEGCRFDVLVDEARRRHALARVGCEGSLQQLAWELSYLQPSTLVRAFSRWTGLTPTAYREAHRAPTGAAPEPGRPSRETPAPGPAAPQAAPRRTTA
ncbi:MAG: AraC family transcriptional regulator ligand-binding domain-containing protein [Myxococcaceae bacterium]|nr:AraC family transcriptional regulator ligand-binding domain-containing protein [Myxococcaceae bacterium]